MRDLALLGGVRDRDLPLRVMGVWERDLSLLLALDLVLLAGGVPERSRLVVVLAACFGPEREISGDELDLSLWVEPFSLFCLLEGSSGEELREARTGFFAKEGAEEEEDEEEEEEQLPLSEGERERCGGEPSREVFLSLVSMALEAGDEDAVGCCLCSGDVLDLDDGRAPLRSSGVFFGGGDAEAGDRLSLEEARLCPEALSGESFGIGERLLNFESCSNEGVDFRPPCRAAFFSLSLSFSLAGGGGVAERCRLSCTGERLDATF